MDRGDFDLGHVPLLELEKCNWIWVHFNCRVIPSSRFRTKDLGSFRWGSDHLRLAKPRKQVEEYRCPGHRELHRSHQAWRLYNLHSKRPFQKECKFTVRRFGMEQCRGCRWCLLPSERKECCHRRTKKDRIRLPSLPTRAFEER